MTNTTSTSAPHQSIPLPTTHGIWYRFLQVYVAQSIHSIQWQHVGIIHWFPMWQYLLAPSKWKRWYSSKTTWFTSIRRHILEGKLQIQRFLIKNVAAS
jgi:hypothetical protein